MYARLKCSCYNRCQPGLFLDVILDRCLVSEDTHELLQLLHEQSLLKLTRFDIISFVWLTLHVTPV